MLLVWEKIHMHVLKVALPEPRMTAVLEVPPDLCVLSAGGTCSRGRGGDTEGQPERKDPTDDFQATGGEEKAAVPWPPRPPPPRCCSISPTAFAWVGATLGEPQLEAWPWSLWEKEGSPTKALAEVEHLLLGCPAP